MSNQRLWSYIVFVFYACLVIIIDEEYTFSAHQ